jgi:hypothetical protein
MILLSAGMGCCIEFWKIGKAMHIEVFFSQICVDNYILFLALFLAHEHFLQQMCNEELDV